MLGLITEAIGLLREILSQLKFNNKAGYTLNEAALYSGIGINNLRNMCNAGIIHVKWIGGKRVIPRWAIDDYLLNGASYETETGAEVVSLARK